RRTVITTGLERKTIPFQQREVNKTERFPTTDRIISRGTSRRSWPLVILSAALINFDHRLKSRIIVTPISPHPRGRAVRSADAIKEAQVLVKHLRVRGMPLEVARGNRETGQGAHAAIRK